MFILKKKSNLDKKRELSCKLIYFSDILQNQPDNQIARQKYNETLLQYRIEKVKEIQEKHIIKIF